MVTRRHLGEFVLADRPGPCSYCGEPCPVLNTEVHELLHVGRCTRARYADIDAAGAGCDYRRCEPDDCALELLPVLLRPFRCRYRADARRT